MHCGLITALVTLSSGTHRVPPVSDWERKDEVKEAGAEGQRQLGSPLHLFASFHLRSKVSAQNA